MSLEYVLLNGCEGIKPIKSQITGKYAILFDPNTGFELTQGINGNPDPFSLEYPSLMDLGIMGHCKNNCKVCYQGDANGPNMTLDNFKKIIDQSSKFVNQIALGGKGDPNLHENFEEILKYCVENRIVPNYTTSGNGFTEDHAELSKKYCGSVAVSDYGEEYTFNALNLLIKYGVKTNIHTIFARNTFFKSLNILKGIIRWSDRVDISKLNGVVFLLFKPQGRGKNFTVFKPSDLMIKEFRRVMKDSAPPYKIGLDSCFVCRLFECCNDFTDEETIMSDFCEGARFSVYIGSDMKMIPCSFSNHNEYGVDITERSIKDVWDNSESFIKFRKTISDNNYKCPLEF